MTGERTLLEDLLLLSGPAGFAYLYAPDPGDPESLAGCRRWTATVADVWIIHRPSGDSVGYRVEHPPGGNPFDQNHWCLYQYPEGPVRVVRAMLALPSPHLWQSPYEARPMVDRTARLAAPFAALVGKAYQFALGERPAEQRDRAADQSDEIVPGNLSAWFSGTSPSLAASQ